eukprot:7883982-Pyramimonas_sp.AAC.1
MLPLRTPSRLPLDYLRTPFAPPPDLLGSAVNCFGKYWYRQCKGITINLGYFAACPADRTTLGVVVSIREAANC